MAKTHVDARGQQLLDARVATADRVVIEAALQDRVIERIGHHVQTSAPNVDDQPAGICIVVGVHRGRVAGRYPALHVEADGFGGEHLEKPRVLVVGFVAMDVDQLVEFMSERHGKLHGLLAVLAGQFEMRDAADHIRPHFDGATHQGFAIGEGLNALLRKCHQLQRDLIGKLLPDLQQRP